MRIRYAVMSSDRRWLRTPPVGGRRFEIGAPVVFGFHVEHFDLLHGLLACAGCRFAGPVVALTNVPIAVYVPVTFSLVCGALPTSEFTRTRSSAASTGRVLPDKIRNRDT